ncbi:phosphotransferase [Nonomuraea sp. NPDC049607]|uniref:phosphotransferase family protein n=1 Tax=Nonomuraea sp. NPDC049607 TaxID=3154732 RepID=UPI003441ABDD
MAGHLLKERAAAHALQSSVPAPRLLWTDDVEGWHLLLFDHVDGTPADLSPGSADLAGVMEAVASIARPCTWPAPPATRKIGGLLRVAQEHLAESPTNDLEPLVKALDVAAFDGDILVHGDLHQDNLLAHHGRVQIVDWSMACRGSAWLDVALLVPRLVDAGHTAAEAEQVAALVPAWADAPREQVTALAAVRSLFASRMAEVGPQHLTAKRRWTAEACRAWVEYRTEL